MRKRATPPPPPEEDVGALWEAWRAHHRQVRREAPSPDGRKALVRMLVECDEGVAILRDYMDWVHTSPDLWARQLRGEAPWYDGSTVAHLDLEGLGRHLAGRLAATRAWVAAGRPRMGRAERQIAGSGERAWAHLVALVRDGGYSRYRVPEAFHAEAGKDRLLREALERSGGWVAFIARDGFTEGPMRKRFVAETEAILAQRAAAK